VERQEWDPHLSQLSTEWTLVFQAHRGTPEQVGAAQVALMGRYAGAVHRYLLAALRDPEAAAELDQEFALRFLRGDFHRADPSRGRFRDFVKQALRNLMIDHRRRGRARPRPMGDGLPEAAAPEDQDFDRRFLESWRSELLARAWEALAQLQKKTGQPYHTVLRLRVEHPELRSPEMAERLSAALGRPISAGGLRMALQRSRDRFVEFLLEEVAGSLKAPTADQLERELIDVGLFEYCRPALKRRGRDRPT
jgi:DNA-directed RNA polymerase specialized sigma24 family protein